MTKDSHDHSHYEKSSQLSSEDLTKNRPHQKKKWAKTRTSNFLPASLLWNKTKGHVVVSLYDFLDYAMQWWYKTVMDIGLNKRLVVVSWCDLKECMRTRFVPAYYRKELLFKLQRLQHGPSSVDEYFKELETILTKIDMHESDESKISRFLSGLRREIQDVVELYEYSTLEKLVHLTIKVEFQLSKKTHFKNSHNDGYYQSSWKNKNKSSSKTFPSNVEKDSTYNPRHYKPSTSTTTKTSSKSCFKCLGLGHIASNCPSKRNMMVKGGLS